MWSPPPEHPLRRLFAGLTEQTFLSTLGLADPPLTDYLSELLSRFVHVHAIYRLRDAAGRRLEEVAEMMIEAEAMPPEGRTRREVHRHIGDFALFWTGVYPEALTRLRSVMTKDHFIDYWRRASAPTTSPAPSAMNPTATRPPSCGASATSSNCAPTG